MKQYVASIASVCPYFQSRSYEREYPKPQKEGHDAYESRTWMYRTHVNDDGQLIIPAEAFQFSIRDGAIYLSEKIPGRGNEKWSKHFVSGILIPDDIVLPERRETAQGQWLYLHANGNRTSGRRVWRKLPFIQQWSGDLGIYVLDDLITEDILKRVIQHAGAFIGVGQNRPQNGGRRGRFRLVELIEVAADERMAA